ncbi:peroxidase [Fragilaria crotonensis]|nr:peroxidase [Fragilaria crotonensis]KAI2495211.1 peroxidase [Fragilaria crotonensis]
MAIPNVHGFSVPTTAIFQKSIALQATPRRHDDNGDQSLIREMTIKDRRTFLLLGSAFLTTTAGMTANIQPAMAADATTPAAVDYKAVAADIAKLITEDPDKGPTLVRLAWHSSGTYDKMSKTGGSGGGTIRFKEELDHGGNAGLAVTAVQWMEPIYKAHPGISYADLYTLGGVAAIKTLGGPTIPWSSGRVDELDPSAVTPDGRLPNADVGPKGADPSDAQHLRDIFYRMGFNDAEIVCLSGAHALGRCHPTASGYDGPWTPTPTVFNNAYYTILQNLKWVEKEWDGPTQYVNSPSGSLMMLPSDLVLLQDKKFAKYVSVYAKDGAKFNSDFTKAFQKLEELGTSGLTPTEWA